MKILFIATGYLPYTFSENLCNAKLVYALQKSGWNVDVVSKCDEGPTYSSEWKEPWTLLQTHCHEIKYHKGKILIRLLDTLYSCVIMKTFPLKGVRWARRAYDESARLLKINHYDAVLTRSPNDISHLVGLKLKLNFGIKWIANWNDPAVTIWPQPYTHHLSHYKRRQFEKLTVKYLKNTTVNTFPSKSLLDHFIVFYPFLKQSQTYIIPHISLHQDIFPKQRYLEKSRKFRMCHSGNLSAERNPELTFRAIKALVDEGYDNIEFHVMGYINEYTQDLIDKYELKNVVLSIGTFSYMDALKKMQEYNCLVLLEAIMDYGIFFPSKFTDYAQSRRPILAISPQKGFASAMIKEFGGGEYVDNKDVECIKKGIKKMYVAWEQGNLSELYDTQLLYQKFGVDTVLEMYKNLLQS